ncbi:questin oxidase family protein [Aquimarina sediminis]|uniref:questin oxidase family protein n=1 Tax=Aquimarina sediminis TaxID=2070536 RepID=UPI0013E8BD08|nr:questin oxidase family protein [Aquimarina sediminis]
MYHPSYNNGISSHTPMSLVALDCMGASELQLKNYYERSTSKLDYRKDRSQENDFYFSEDTLGQKDQFENYFYYFSKALEKTSTEKLLGEVIPILIKGVAGSAFHPIIRLSYALQTNYKPEIAMSLAYWASEYLELGNSFEQSAENLAEIRTKLNSYAINFTSSIGLITDRITLINTNIQKDNVIIQPHKITLNDIRDFCLGVFAKKNDFTLLHTVTACHAYRIISKYFLNNDISLRYFWEAIVMAQISTGLPYRNTEIPSTNTDNDWSFVLKQACDSLDDHVIKLVYTCWEENKNTPSILYNFIARRAINS